MTTSTPALLLLLLHTSPHLARSSQQQRDRAAHVRPVNCARGWARAGIADSTQLASDNGLITYTMQTSSNDAPRTPGHVSERSQRRLVVGQW